MKKLLRVMLSSSFLNIVFSFTLLAETQSIQAPPVRNSILETDITPYLESQNCSTQASSVSEELIQARLQISEAELLLSGTAIPDSSSIDSLVATIFSLAPCSNCGS